MLITIDTNDTPASAADLQAIVAAKPAMSASDAGGGPPSDNAAFDTQAAPSSAVDGGGPSAWLTAAIAAAESKTSLQFGYAPVSAPMAKTVLTTVEDAGSGPSDGPAQ